MLERLCAHLHNYFERHPTTHEQMIHAGTYTITGGSIELPFLLSGQRFRIKGSALNDGVYTYGETIRNDDDTAAADLYAETFTGEIWAMSPPKAVLEIAASASEWMTKHGEALNSPYTSESFGGYSYTKGATDATDGMPAGTWYGVPKSALAQWRKVYSE